ncbi:hypothetical protein DFP72DRAFT_1065045 [Ephemerocybe angulata]|uniref:Uncharacterized protein n=1 Tax=Ephemerocybe angulata TaxID=980116 RepID=A0A8H6I3R0_9AGAR|nr:hypothetical protein DFP72DRAFT_1065045 [Tulosesus angulatus]
MSQAWITLAVPSVKKGLPTCRPFCAHIALTLPSSPAAARTLLASSRRALFTLISSVPPQTPHSYCRSHLNLANFPPPPSACPKLPQIDASEAAYGRLDGLSYSPSSPGSPHTIDTRVRREESETSDEERPAKRKRAVTLEKEADARGGFRRRATRKGGGGGAAEEAEVFEEAHPSVSSSNAPPQLASSQFLCQSALAVAQAPVEAW